MEAANAPIDERRTVKIQGCFFVVVPGFFMQRWKEKNGIRKTYMQQYQVATHEQSKDTNGGGSAWRKRKVDTGKTHLPSVSERSRQRQWLVR
jgi:hypothetical protein